jgi:tetratricopeptide (TPR) repeat protein
MEPSTSNPSSPAQRWLDRVLILLVAAFAFALGCQELYDADIWWHVRAGQFIWSQAKIPATDPFTSASFGRPWIDLHWFFQLLLAAAHAAGGVQGMILFAAFTCATAVLVALSARDRRSPTWLLVLCWLPAIWLMSARFIPRPEILSLLGIAVYLSVLHRAEHRPALSWTLVPVQIAWVNAHALSVLGPVIMVLYLVDRLVRSRIDSEKNAPPAAAIEQPEGRGAPTRPTPRTAARPWLHLAGAFATVLLACLINPYGLAGALFPLQLVPKLSAAGELYKSNIIELMSLHDYIRRQSVPIAAANLYMRAECFLFWMLPLAIIFPVLWRKSTAKPARRHPQLWLDAFGLASCAIVITVAGLPGEGTPGLLIKLGRWAPFVPAALGIAGARHSRRSSSYQFWLSLLGGSALSAWIVWSRLFLFDIEPWPTGWPGPRPLGITTAVLGAGVIALVLVGGASLFRLLLAAAFGTLAFQAIRNVNLFGLIAGYVVASEVATWLANLSQTWPLISKDRPRTVVSPAASVAVAILTVLLIIATVDGSLFRATREQRSIALSAAPLAYAHAAARFAGQLGLPDRALVYDLRQAAVYEFHNGPIRKPFLDGRLEVAEASSFETYIKLGNSINRGMPGWKPELESTGAPLILLDHEKNSGTAATLLADPDWRCVYFDAVASVFVSASQPDVAHRFPAVDFAGRHFAEPGQVERSAPAAPKILVGEARALLDLERSLEKRPGSNADVRASILLLAGDRLREALDANPSSAETWALLGNAAWRMTALWSSAPNHPGEPWNPAFGLVSAQSSYAYQRTLELDAGQITALFGLHDTFRLRRMDDAQRSVSTLMRRAFAAARDPDFDPTADLSSPQTLPEIALPIGNDPDEPASAIATLLRQGRPEAAVSVYNQAESPGVVFSWSISDRVAIALLYLGNPSQAHRIWERASSPPSLSHRLARLATASLAMFDWTKAQQSYTAALELDPMLAEARFGLTLLHTQRGNRTQATESARRLRQFTLTPAEKSFLDQLDRLTTPPAPR